MPTSSPAMYSTRWRFLKIIIWNEKIALRPTETRIDSVWTWNPIMICSIQLECASYCLLPTSTDGKYLSSTSRPSFWRLERPLEMSIWYLRATALISVSVYGCYLRILTVFPTTIGRYSPIRCYLKLGSLMLRWYRSSFKSSTVLVYVFYCLRSLTKCFNLVLRHWLGLWLTASMRDSHSEQSLPDQVSFVFSDSKLNISVASRSPSTAMKTFLPWIHCHCPVTADRSFSNPWTQYSPRYFHISTAL